MGRRALRTIALAYKQLSMEQYLKIVEQQEALALQ